MLSTVSHLKGLGCTLSSVRRAFNDGGNARAATALATLKRARHTVTVWGFRKTPFRVADSVLQLCGLIARLPNARPKLTVLQTKQAALRDLMCERGCVRVRLSCSLLATLRRFDVFACAAVSPCLVIYWLIYKAGWVRLSGALVRRHSLVEGKHFVCASQPFKFFPARPPF